MSIRKPGMKRNDGSLEAKTAQKKYLNKKIITCYHDPALNAILYIGYVKGFGFPVNESDSKKYQEMMQSLPEPGI
ncbi:MAG: hypothetical protein MZV63_34660 [Marinilabiliales bacterium]|nr:hypothetical protein [Marinilabiliales bacterium]